MKKLTKNWFKRYSELYKLFLNCSNEKSVIAKEIIKEIKPKKFWKFLDVGCGSGEITEKIARKVEKTLGIDYNPFLLNEFKKRIKNKKIKLLLKDWNKLRFPSKFDLVLASHIFFSPTLKNWEKVIEKLIYHVKEGGYLVIVHHMASGEYNRILKKFWKKIKGKPYRREKDHKYIIKLLENLGYKPKGKKIITFLKIPSLKKALNLIEWMFGGTSIKNAHEKNVEKEIVKYFNKLKKKGLIVIETHHALIWVKK